MLESTNAAGWAVAINRYDSSLTSSPNDWGAFFWESGQILGRLVGFWMLYGAIKRQVDSREGTYL